MLKVVDTSRHTRRCRSKQAHFYTRTLFINTASSHRQASCESYIYSHNHCLINLLLLLYRPTDSHTYLGYDTLIHVPIAQVFSKHSRSFLSVINRLNILLIPICPEPQKGKVLPSLAPQILFVYLYLIKFHNV